MQNGERLVNLLQALGQLVENYGGKNNAKDALQLLGILKVHIMLTYFCQIMLTNKYFPGHLVH
jgi:hypothetical protein